MPDQSPQRQLLQTPLTPIIGDVLVAITQPYDRGTLPSYGTKLVEVHNAGKQDRFKNHVLTLASPQPDSQSQEMYTLYFAAPREDQDTYAWEATQADIGGNKFDAVARTYVTPRTSYTMASPAMGAAMPSTPTNKFPGTYILAAKEQKRLPKELDGYFVAETHVYVRKVSITNLGVDPLNGRPLTTIRTIYHKDEAVTGATTAAQLFAEPSNAYWGTQSTGYAHTGQQLSSEFYEITQEQVVGGTMSGGTILVADYFTTENYSWPAVLGSIPALQFDLVAGGTEYYPYPVFSKQAHNGPCRAQIVIRWSASEFSVSTPQVMRPLPIHINTPFYSVDVVPSLHGSLELNLFITDHPKYEDVAGTITEPATTPTDWPSQILASDSQRPYRGGWLRETVTIFQPSYAAS